MKLSQKYQEYKERAGTYISYETFMKPSELVEFHERCIGTVVKKIDHNLSIYPHIVHFGCMLFFTRLTEQLIVNGPIVYKTVGGETCAV